MVNPLNHSRIRDNAKLVALIAKPEELFKRVQRRKSRPLLTESEDPLQTLKDLWAERKESYMNSDLQIETNKKNVEIIAKEIIKELKLERSSSNKLRIQIPEEAKRYSIIFDDLSKMDLSTMNLGKKVLLVSQEPIAKHYLDKVVAQLSQYFEVHTHMIGDGEDSKNFFSYQGILHKLLEFKFERKDTVLALGGGVVGDIAGFAASTYFRGIHYIQVPTTLLAMIDSSVGGKTAINAPQGKNLIGTFYQPRRVYIDVRNLKTLPDREYRSGLGELIKYTMLGERWDDLLGESFFAYITRHAEDIVNKKTSVLIDVIEHCLQIKSQIVMLDEREQGIRAHLNLGHTFAHGIEEVTQYSSYSHGEAVAMGTVCACYLAEELGLFKSGHIKKVLDLMDALGLEHKIPESIKTEDIIRGCQHDKKAEGGKLRWIVPKGQIGNVTIVHDIDEKLIRKAIDSNR